MTTNGTTAHATTEAGAVEHLGTRGRVSIWSNGLRQEVVQCPGGYRVVGSPPDEVYIDAADAVAAIWPRGRRKS